MKDLQASETSGVSPRDGDGAFLAVTAAALAAFALVNTFSVLHDVSQQGGRLPFWEPFVWETTSIVVIFAMLPGWMWFARRYWPLDPPWWRPAVAHGFGVIAFSVVHILGMGVLRWAVYELAGASYAPLAPLGDFLYEFRKDALGYVGFVGLYVAWGALRRPRELASAASQPQAIEVRDGSRRQFVPLAEIGWIEAAGNYVHLQCGQASVLHRASLSEMGRRLEGEGFVRIHRSRLVRRTAIAQVESRPSGDYVVRLADGRELVGSRRYRRPLLAP